MISYQHAFEKEVFKEGTHHLKGYHGKVYLLEELEDVIAEFGYPRGYLGKEIHNFDKYIEVQIWEEVFWE